MSISHQIRFALLLVATSLASGTWAAPPRVLVEDYTLELVAREPDIVTPVAVAFDQEGRLLVVESHTHQRPDGYEGPTSDRIRQMEDSDGDGRLDRWTTFADGFRHAMNVVVREDGAVVVVTRGDIFLLRDTSGDGAADQRKTLVHLQSDVDYPHNALGGFVFDKRGGFYLGLGENFGGAYRLIGSDGAEFADAGGTGMVFHFANDGSQLRRVAQGFWNPFGLAIAGTTSLFAVDNDPDASPPCRLIHVVETGDYGHRFEYGRAGVHPLQAWDGELPGTLPMVCGTGEAPCAVVPHEDFLWVTSWGDHRLERYDLTAEGASFSGRREVVVQGDADFRPTGCAVAPDGSLYFADWVSRSYPVHGMGRIWRLDREGPREPAAEWQAIETVEAVRQANQDKDRLASSDGFQRQMAIASLSEEDAMLLLDDTEPKRRLAALQALRWQTTAAPEEILRRALHDADAQVRLYAIRWIADHHLVAFRDQVASLLEAEVPNEQYYLAVLSAVHWLDGDRSTPPKSIADGLLARELRNRHRSDATKALALRLISPDHEQLTLEVLLGWVNKGKEPLPTEAIRSLVLSDLPERFGALARLATDAQLSEGQRADALVGLHGRVKEYTHLFTRLADGESAVLQHEAQRALRLARVSTLPAEPKPPASDIDAWLKLTDGRGKADSGRRLFFSQLGPRCGTCHTVNGRGGDFGPDLTRYGQEHDRRALLTAILRPSRDIAPRYVPWLVETSEGRTYTGLRLPLAGDGGVEPYVDEAGNRFELKSEDVEYREPSTKSIMPEGLETTIPIDDLADLVAFLMAATTE